MLFADREAGGYRDEWYDDAPARAHLTILRVREAGFLNSVDASLAAA